MPPGIFAIPSFLYPPPPPPILFVNLYPPFGKLIVFLFTVIVSFNATFLFTQYFAYCVIFPYPPICFLIISPLPSLLYGHRFPLPTIFLQLSLFFTSFRVILFLYPPFLRISLFFTSFRVILFFTSRFLRKSFFFTIRFYGKPLSYSAVFAIILILFPSVLR